MLPGSLDDVDAILVYADELISRGHPHGKLIALQHGKKTREAKSWLRKHAGKILGKLVIDDDLVTAEWENGFIRSACIHCGDGDEPDELSLIEEYDTLRASPAAQLIRELSLGQVGPAATCTADHAYCYEPLFAHMAKHPLRTLRVLDVGGEVVKAEFNCAHGLYRVLAEHPHLEEISIAGGRYELGSPKLPELEKLHIAADHSSETIRDLAKADLPRLEELGLYGGAGAMTIDDDPTAADYEKLFASARMPALKRLSFGRPHGDVGLEAVRGLLESKLVKRLEALRINFIDDDTADLIIENPAPLRHIKTLSLDRSRVSPPRRKAMKQALPRLR